MTTLIPPTQAEFAIAETLNGRIVRVVSLSLNDPNSAEKFALVGSFWTHPALNLRVMDEAGKLLGYGELVVVVREEGEHGQH